MLCAESEQGRVREAHGGRAPEEARERLATAEEVARAALFFASDLASAVTGQILNVDCGEFHA